MKITTRMAMGLGLVAVLMIAAVGYQLSVIQKLQGLNQDLAETSLEAARTSIRVLQAMEEVGYAAQGYAVAGDARYREVWLEWEEEVERNLELLGGLELDPEQAELRSSIENGWQRYHALSADLPSEPVDAQTAEEEGTLPTLDELVVDLRGLIDELGSDTDRLIAKTSEAAAARSEASAEAAERAQAISWLAAGLALLVGSSVFLILFASISGPLRRLTRGTRELAQGRFDHRLEVRGRHELAALARDFNHMAARLDELDDLKRDFVSHVSHELKGPLAAIHETILVLLEEIPGPLTEKQQQLLTLSRDSANRLSGMITNLLEASRLEAGVDNYEPVRTDLIRVTRSVLDEFEGLTTDRDQRLVLETTAGDAGFLADEDRVREVVANLVGNASKFSPPGSRIGVTVAEVESVPEGVPGRWDEGLADEPGPFVLLSVEDQGPGVPDGHKESIFEKFHQVKRGGRIHGQGVGLGLAISSRIVEAHGGAIWVEDAPDGGALFHVLLPREPTRWRSMVAREADEPSAPAGPAAARDSRSAGSTASASGIGLALLLAAGCGGGPAESVDQPAPEREPIPVVDIDELLEDAEEEDGVVNTRSREGLLSDAQAYLVAGAHEEAAFLLATLLDEPGSSRSGRTAEALWSKALVHLLPESPVHDPEKAQGILTRLTEDHPQTLQGTQAAWLLEVLGELRRSQLHMTEQERLLQELEETVEQLKRIDLERRPRRPTPDSLLPPS